MNLQERAASWSAVIHLLSITLLGAAIWLGEQSATQQPVTVNFSLQPSAPNAKDELLRTMPASESPRPTPRHSTATLPQPQPVEQPQTPSPFQPVAGSPEEAVLPYHPPTPERLATETVSPLVAAPPTDSSPSAGQSATIAEFVEQQKTRYLLEQFAYIHEAILKKTNYPYLARKNGWSGTVVVRFTIEKDGQVSDVLVDKSSGVLLLDQAATETVKFTAPFPRPPVRAEIIVPISYRLG